MHRIVHSQYFIRTEVEDCPSTPEPNAKYSSEWVYRRPSAPDLNADFVWRNWSSRNLPVAAHDFSFIFDTRGGRSVPIALTVLERWRRLLLMIRNKLDTGTGFILRFGRTGFLVD